MKQEKTFPNSELLNWYHQNKRDLPWRETSNPYYIWLSEIILQQTRVDQGMPYYERFVSTFLTVQDLASASEDEVLKLWEGLGYYSRARNLHATAKYVAGSLDGKFPITHQGLLALKGVGPYTAAAIGSIAYGLNTAAVDGNVYRVLARYFGITDSIDETATKKLISKLASDILDKKEPGNHNQAVMELGATVCTPQQPDCANCPIRLGCDARKTGSQLELPVRSKKVKVRNRFFNYSVILVGKEVAISRRGDGDIWHGLYEFPFHESEKSLEENEIISMVNKGDSVIISVSQEYKHVLSHQRIYGRFVLLKQGQKSEGDYMWVSVDDLRNFAFPRLINKYLDSQSFVIDAEVSNI